jgi:hypothetical protein
MCPIPNGSRDRAISLYSTLYTVQTSNTPCPHTDCKVHWCWRWNFRKCIILRGARGSIVGWSSMLHAGRSRGLVPIRWIFQFTSSFQPHCGPGVDSANNRNEYQESFWGVKGDQRVVLTTLPPSVSRLCRQNVTASTSHNPMVLHGLLQR